MQEKVLAKEAMPAFLERLIGHAITVAPVKRPDGYFNLQEVARADEIALDCNFLYYSPKKFVLPAYETTLRFGRQAGKAHVEAVKEAGDIILFGLHPCDINAIWTLDGAFGSDTKDENYLYRRDHVTVIGVDCFQPCDEYCFCNDMKTNEAQGSYDLLLSDMGDRYFVRVGTAKGLKLLGVKTPDASTADRAALQKAQKARDKNFPKRIGYDTSELPKRLEQNYDSMLWETTGKRCYSCGSCNLVCPTCYCFNVEDKLQMNLTDGERQRYWDSCQLPGFAEMAGGENFRPQPAQRLRHRFFRKGKLIKEALGRPGCVGCGRCDRACTSKISIVATFNELKGGA